MNARQSRLWKGTAVFILLTGPCGISWVQAAQPHLDDAQYEGSRAHLAPLTHEFPRKVLSETKTLPDTAEALSKYDGVAVTASQMTTKLAEAQRLNPSLLVLRKFNPVGFLGGGLENPCANAFAPPFGAAGPATTGCSMYPGHWLYNAGTTLTGSVSTSTLEITVADGTRISAGVYVVIYDAPAGSFRNAEHALVQSVSGDRVTLQMRGYKSIARPHAAGSIIATHIIAGTAKGVPDPLHWMYNLSSACPKDSNGHQIADVLATWIVNNYDKDKQGRRPNNLRVHGLLFDTDTWSIAWRNRIDANNDLVADAGWEETAGLNLWGEGSERFYELVRRALPDKLVVGGARNVRGFETLNGVQMESWPASAGFFSPEPSYKNLDELIGNYTLHLQLGQPQLPAYTENLSKVPTRLYSDGLSPRPASNAAFRFAFGTTLLEDGYYAQEPTKLEPDKWWDEFAVDVDQTSPTYGFAVKSNPADEALARAHGSWLGMPLGGRKRIYKDEDFEVERSLIRDGSLDTSSAIEQWRGVNVTLALDKSERLSGPGALRVSRHSRYVSTPSAASAQGPSVTLKGGVDYTLAFAARANETREISVNAGGRTQSFLIPDFWVRRVFNFTPVTSGTYRIGFNVGRENVEIWLDDVYLFEGNTNVYSREFEGGLVVVNASTQSRSIDLQEPFMRIRGTGQDPINDGSVVKTLVVPAFDAAFLVREKQQPILVSVDDVRIAEGGGVAELRARLSRPVPLGRKVSVKFRTSGGTAVAGQDFRAASGTLMFDSGEAEKSVSVRIENDTVLEEEEFFTLVLEGAMNAQILRSSATAHIEDDDVPLVSCGAPALDTVKSRSGVYIWRDCTSEGWRILASGDGTTVPTRFSGEVLSDADFTKVTAVDLEHPADTLDLSNPKRIGFVFKVLSQGVDGVDFSVPVGSSSCVNIHAAVQGGTIVERNVYFGKDAVQQTSPFSLGTFESCSSH